MIIFSLLLPLVFIPGLLVRHPLAWRLLPSISLPALYLAAMPTQQDFPVLLTGLRLGVDQPGAVMLFLASLLWLCAGVYAQGYIDVTGQRRFGVFWCLTWVGTLGTIMALDAVSFYLLFTWMSLSAYGLIVHSGSEAAQRAGRIYLIMAMLGEALTLPALMLLVGPAGDATLAALPERLSSHPWQALIMGLLISGFGIKLGVLPLHIWLPLAHPAAPTPASAVLSGVLIKLGLLAWLRFLPLGELALPTLSAWLIALGMAGAFYGVVVGIGQQQAKTVLAYSSISQMGLVIALLGMALGQPEHWPRFQMLLLLFMLHHGLAKGALFLGHGVLTGGNPWAMLGLALPALSLAGAPMTSGALAKTLYKDLSPLAPGDWPSLLGPILSLSSAVTALLLLRFLLLCWPRNTTVPKPIARQLWLPWLVLILAGLWLPWFWGLRQLPQMSLKILLGASAPGLLLPLAGGLTLALLAHRWHWPPRVPEGDILALWRYCSRFVDGHLPRLSFPSVQYPTLPVLVRVLKLIERRLRRWSVAGVLFLLLIVFLVGLSL